MERASERQRAHYDSILSDYDRHYYDEESYRYRTSCFYRPLFSGLRLDGKRVADLACGSGYNSLAVLDRFPKADVCGLDISPEACRNYEQLTSRSAHCIDLTQPAAPLPGSVDVALIVGGLHHCVADLPATFDNLARLVTPGGWLLMIEPNADFFLNALRLLWYRHDRYFEHETERPLHHDDLIRLAGERFRPVDVRYMGGPAYFLVLNSLLFRLPGALKRVIAQPLLGLEVLYNKLPGKAPFPYFVARWRRCTA